MGIEYYAKEIIRESWKLYKLNDLRFQKGYFGRDVKDEAGDRQQGDWVNAVMWTT